MSELADALAYERGARFTLSRCYDCLAPCPFDAVLCAACKKVYADEKACRRAPTSGSEGADG